MQFRSDYKFALIDEYSTHWNGYEDEDEFYGDLLSSSTNLLQYLKTKNDKIIGTAGWTEMYLNSQNQLYIIYYSNDKQYLETIDDLHLQENVLGDLQKQRFFTKSFFAS